MEDSIQQKKIVFNIQNYKTVFLFTILALNLVIILFHINKFFSHPDNIVVKDGFFFKSKVIHPVKSTNEYNFPILSIIKVSANDNLFKIIPKQGYTLKSVYNISNYTKISGKSKKRKLLGIFSKRIKEKFAIDFTKNVFYKIDKNDKLALSNKKDKNNDIESILYKIRGGNYIISQKPILLNSVKIDSGAYFKLKESGGIIPITLNKDENEYSFFLKNYKNYLLLVRKEKRYRGDFRKSDKILLNFDNKKNNSIFFDHSDSKGILYKESNQFFFSLIPGEPKTNPPQLKNKSFFLDNVYISINPYSYSPRYIIFTLLLFITILFFTFDKRLIPLIEMKIVFLSLVLLYSINYLLSYDIYFRFGLNDYFSERLLIIPLLLIIFYVFNNNSKNNLPFYLLCISLIFLQLLIGKIGKFHTEDYIYLVILISISFIFFGLIKLGSIPRLLRKIESIKYSEISLMFILTIFFGVMASFFKEAIHIGGIRLELATIMKLPLLYYFSLCFSQIYKSSNKKYPFRYVLLLSAPILIVTSLSKDQGFFYLIFLFSIFIVLFYLPIPYSNNDSSRTYEGLKNKGFLVISFILIFAILLGMGNFALKLKIEEGIWRMPVDLFKTFIGRTTYHPSTLDAFETQNYQKNLIRKVEFFGKKEFQIDKPFLSSYLVNDYMYLYLLLNLGFFWGFIIIMIYCLIFWFSLNALKKANLSDINKIALFFYILSVSYFCFQSLYQILSQLGIRGIPFTGKEVYLLSCGRTQVVFTIILFSLLNSMVTKSGGQEENIK